MAVKTAPPPPARAGAVRSFVTGWIPALALLAFLSAGALAFVQNQGWTLYYGDASAHLGIARRIVDSITPGYDQLGTVWLPLPHLLMLPLVGTDWLWYSGLAGAFPAAVCFVLGGVFLFAAARRAFDSPAAGWTALALYALNPNLLYLQATPMTEPVFLACLAALLYFTVLFRESQSWLALGAAALAACAATLARYEGWFLIPFATLYILLAARRNRLWAAVLFGFVASLGPLAWLAHNQWYYSDALEFYHGQYSAKAIYQRALDRGMARYPGDHDWPKAWLYYRSAVLSACGTVLAWLGLAGAVAALVRRVVWPLVLLALPVAFYVLSLYSSGTPIFLPDLWPNSYYNTRYGLEALPALAFAAAALVALCPEKLRRFAGLALVAAALVPWLVPPSLDRLVCWKESQVNSETRRHWTRQAADYLRANSGPQDRVFSSLGDLADLFRQARIPLRQVLHEGNDPLWTATAKRPDLFLDQEWVVGFSGDAPTAAAQRAGRGGTRYDCVQRITAKGGPVVEIYRRAVPVLGK